MCVLTYFFFFKQKTAYEMRISDWSSDVCSSDLWYDTDIDGPIRQNLFFNAPAAFGPAKPIVDGIAAAERDAFGGNPNLAAYTSPSAVVGADSRGPFNKTKTQTYMAKFILDTSRSEEHTSELQSLMRISYAVFCLKKKKDRTHHKTEQVQITILYTT